MEKNYYLLYKKYKTKYINFLQNGASYSDINNLFINEEIYNLLSDNEKNEYEIGYYDLSKNKFYYKTDIIINLKKTKSNKSKSKKDKDKDKDKDKEDKDKILLYFIRKKGVLAEYINKNMYDLMTPKQQVLFIESLPGISYKKKTQDQLLDEIKTIQRKKDIDTENTAYKYYLNTI